MLRILSLGAGVQSSTLALMMKHGEVEPVQHAVFADTGDEPHEVYAWLSWLERELPFPVHRVSAGRLSAESTKLRTAASGRTYLSSSYYIDVGWLDHEKALPIVNAAKHEPLTGPPVKYHTARREP